MRETAPAAAAVVNPNRPGCPSGQGVLAAAGVTFVLLAALNREARRRGLFAAAAEPDLRQWLDLAALGAVCDVTAFTGFNRALVGQGLKVMSAWGNPGLKALLDVAGAKGPASVFHAGFILGPRINAGGRIGRSDLGARLLSTDDADEARALALELDALNRARKDVERGIFDEAIPAHRSGNQPRSGRPGPARRRRRLAPRCDRHCRWPSARGATASRRSWSAWIRSPTSARAPAARSPASTSAARFRRRSTRAF